MTPEIQRLQVLNDLVAQTIDTINTRAFYGQMGVLPYGQMTQQIGLQPWAAIPSMLPYWQTRGIGQQLGAVPFANIPFAGAFDGLQHTPFVSPQAMGSPLPYAGVSVPQMPIAGLQHTPFQIDPRLAMQLPYVPMGLNLPVSPWIASPRLGIY